MIVITGEIELHPEDVWPATYHAARMMDASAAEDGCICYRFYADLINPRRFRVYEEWRDEAALKAHFASPHMAAFQAALKELRILERNIKKFEVNDVERL